MYAPQRNLRKAMLRIWLINLCACVLLACALWQAGAQNTQRGPQFTEAYDLTLPVNEVVVTFHAADDHGLPVNDLKLSEIKLRDNGQVLGKILAFDNLLGRSLRAGILIDTSESMYSVLPAIRAIAGKYARQLFRQQSDQAFVMDFGYSSETVQPWTSDPNTLAKSIQSIRAGKMNPLGGTALFDTIFRACLYGFSNADRAATGNFLMVFSDGEDNSSHTSLQESLDACQRSNTVIYAFRARSADRDSTGPATLADLALKSGGRVFPADDSEEAILNDLKLIEVDLRNEYRLIYRPAALKHDGSFHRIELQLPDRVSSVQVRSGYYAPAH